MKAGKTERLVIDFVVTHWRILVAIILFLCGFIIRFLLFRKESVDYVCFLHPWFEAMKTAGGIRGLQEMPGNYNAPYMTIIALLTYLPIKDIYSIKAVSVFFDIVLALSASLIAHELAKKKAKQKAVLVFLAVWLSPVVILNGAAWGQCDSIYGSFVLLSIYFLIKKKDFQAFAFLGIAFAFKLQAIFYLPIFLVYWLKKRRFSLLNFLIVPIVDIVLCVPALIFGMPFSRIFEVYAGQVDKNTVAFTMNYPNIWSFVAVGDDVNRLVKAGIVFTIIMLLVLVAFILYRNIKLNKANTVRLVILMAFTMLMFLPGMHERYGFVAEMLALVYFLVVSRNSSLLIYSLVFPLFAYCRFLFGVHSSFEIESLFSVILYVVASRKLLLEMADSKLVTARRNN